MSFKGSKETVINEIERLLEKPEGRTYRYRSRVERTLVRSRELARLDQNESLEAKCEELLQQIRFIAEKSHTSPDGTPKLGDLIGKDLEKVARLLGRRNASSEMKAR